MLGCDKYLKKEKKEEGRKQKAKIPEYMPNSKYAKLWFYLGAYLYTVSVRNISCCGPPLKKFENQFLSKPLEGQLALLPVPEMSLEQPEDENGMCNCH